MYKEIMFKIVELENQHQKAIDELNIKNDKIKNLFGEVEATNKELDITKKTLDMFIAENIELKEKLKKLEKYEKASSSVKEIISSIRAENRE